MPPRPDRSRGRRVPLASRSRAQRPSRNLVELEAAALEYGMDGPIEAFLHDDIGLAVEADRLLYRAQLNRPAVLR